MFEEQYKIIRDMVTELSNTTKRGEKEDIIEKFLTDESSSTVVYKFLWLTYNPYVKFGFFDVDVSTDALSPNLELSDVLDLFIETYENEEFNYREIAKELKTLIFSEKINFNQPVEFWELFTLMFKNDISCGVGIKTINKVIKKVSKPELTKIPEFVLAKAEEEKHLEELQTPFYMNEKYDGARAFLEMEFSDDGMANYNMLSSSGKTFKQLGDIPDVMNGKIEEFRLNKEFVMNGGATFDGELIGFEKDGSLMPRRKSNGIVNKMANGNASLTEIESIKLVIFDCLAYPKYSLIHKDKTPQNERIPRLANFSNNHNDVVSAAEYIVVESHKDGQKFANEIIQQGREGGVAKNIYAPYTMKRSKNWVKIKATYDIDVKVVGHTPHSKNADMIGALSISTSDGLIIGNIGTGKWLTDEKRKELKALADKEELNDIILHIRIMGVEIDKKSVKRFYIPRIEEQRFDKLEADSHDRVFDIMKSHNQSK